MGGLNLSKRRWNAVYEKAKAERSAARLDSEPLLDNTRGVSMMGLRRIRILEHDFDIWVLHSNYISRLSLLLRAE